ncbi:LysM peptidoglycan-binding domain-containing protein [Robiginitomaculum antarcticum]|uniref:LysM peptidoglycan-binding domain-containing protein n=1 Tax=Robiginitomaculum antarcticum TaxID=437507 RepID=UPI0003724C53|nr:LysM peptidoglycan-binding domain-containing protein [Robiginitomaculum antarcticum]
MTEITKVSTIYGEISLFDIPFKLSGSYTTVTDSTTKETVNTVKYTVRVIDKTLGEVLNYILSVVNGPELNLDPPWNVITDIKLDKFAFEIETSNGQSKYGFSYTDLGIDLPFLKMDTLKVLYQPQSKTKANKSFDVSIFGSFLGIDFSDNPITWDALKEQPPATPAGSDKTFKLEYLGLGQRVTLSDISDLDTVKKVIDALQNSYAVVDEEAADPLAGSKAPSLVYDEASTWLIGARFSVLETFDFSGIWNVPSLAGARIGLRGERAKSLGGFEFEILYRRIAEDLGQYHMELVLPDVLRRFNAGAASVTLPIIGLDIYTDGGFKIDLGFPENLDFSRSFTLELIVLGVPVTGSLGLYFGVLSPKAVPDIPAITGGEFRPAIIAGAGFRIGVGKSFTAGILDAGIFVGIEGLLEGIVAFYEPFEVTEPKATFYKVSGHLQLTGHIWGSVDFKIIKAAVDLYAYVSAKVDFESYRMAMVVFEAGVRLKLSIKVGIGWFSFTVDLSFDANVRAEFPIGDDSPTPWIIDQTVGTSWAERIGPVAFRRLPDGKVITDEIFDRLLYDNYEFATRKVPYTAAEDKIALELHFIPVTTVGVKGDAPSVGISDSASGNVNMVATLAARTNRNVEAGEALSPAEEFVLAALDWSILEIKNKKAQLGAGIDESVISASDLRFIKEDLDQTAPKTPINMPAMERFLTEFITLTISKPDSLAKDSQVTPFPMIPFLTLEAGNADAAPTYTADFETTPMCSAQYQKNIAAYFDALNSQSPPSSPFIADTFDPEYETLSMAGLIYVDCFKLVLRSIVGKALDELTLLKNAASGATLQDIASKYGLDSEAAFERMVLANTDNKNLFAEGSELLIAQQAERLSEGKTINGIAGKFRVAKLAAAKYLASQRILAEGQKMTVKGAQYFIMPTDTQQSILTATGMSDWTKIEKANPHFDWSYPQLPITSPPTPPWPEHYPVLHLPAGQWINLPDLRITIPEQCTLQRLCDAYNTRLPDLIEADIPLQSDGLALKTLNAHINDGETFNELMARYGFTGLVEMESALEDNAGIMPTGSALAIPQGNYIIKRGDNLYALADTLQIGADAILEANKDAPWKFVPRPNTPEALPTGVEIILPAVDHYVVGETDTLKSIGRTFGLTWVQIAEHNAATYKLQALASIILPPLVRTAAATGDDANTPSVLAQKFAIPPEAVVRANQGMTSGQGQNAKLGTVLVPDCEIIDRAELVELLSAGDLESALASTSREMARFLMVGLRLPAPGGTAETAVPDETEALYPLYTLTGQQFAAPAAPTVSDWVELKWNDSDDALRMRELCVGAVDPVKINLAEPDISLITSFRTALTDLPGLQPKLLSVSAYPALEQVAIERALGASTRWSIAEPLTFIGDIPPVATDAPAEPSQQIYLHDIPNAMREILPMPTDPQRILYVEETDSDPIINKKSRKIIQNVAWATRLDLQINQLGNPGTEDGTLPHIYEAVSCTSQTQSDLEGLRQYLHAAGKDSPVDLYLLFPSGELSSTAGALRSDVIPADQLKNVVMVKSNLSTFTNPGVVLKSREQIFGDTGDFSSAGFDTPVAFLELLWQISVTNAGGFYLDYGVPADGPGLPDSVFKDGESATISILAVLRSSPTKRDSIAPRRFHNVVINGENLTSDSSTLLVCAHNHDVTITSAPADPQTTQSLTQIAGLYSITVAELGLINATTPNLLIVGSTIELPPTAETPLSYSVEAGDDLLTVALALGLQPGPLSELIKDRTDILFAGAKMQIYAEWVSATNKVAMGNGGIRIVRPVPVEPPPPPPPSSLTALTQDPHYILQTYFNLMGYGLQNNTVFKASPQGLPLQPNDPDETQRNGLYAMATGTPQPWTYQRRIPLSKWANTEDFDLSGTLDPYAGLGGVAKIEFGFQDIFGNKLPRNDAPLTVNWNPLYRDPLTPVHAWPSTTLSYYFETDKQSARRLVSKIKFAPAGYVGAVGVSYKRLVARALADQKKFSDIYYQVVDHRVQAKIVTTLQHDEAEGVDSENLARLSKDAFNYLAAVSALCPVTHKILPDDCLDTIAQTYGVSALDIGEHASQSAALLSPGKTIVVPAKITLQPAMSFNSIIKQSGRKLDLAQIAKLNERLILSPGIILKISGDDFTVPSGSTLEKISGTEHVSVEDIAQENASVEGIFPAGKTFNIGQFTRKIGSSETLKSIAHNLTLALPDLIAANAQTDILAVDQSVEIPLHLTLETKPVCSQLINGEQSLKDFAEKLEGSLRDIGTANSDLSGILAVGQKIYYSAPNSNGSDEVEKIQDNDTLSTIARRIGEKIHNPSVVAADLASYEKNAVNTKLFNAGSRLLTPPIRVTVFMSILSSKVPVDPIFDLATQLVLWRKDSDIDPAFARSDNVRTVSSVIPPRLPSSFTPDQRGTLVAFADNFQEIFEYLKLGTGPDKIISSVKLVAGDDIIDKDSKLIVVNWSKEGLGATVQPDPSFFAPKPLLTELWNAKDVEIFPYVPGQPLRPAPDAFTKTNFANADIERWAQILLRRIDRVLLADMGPVLRKLSIANYDTLIKAKRMIAQAVAGRTSLILAQTDNQTPDTASAQKTLLQQLLVELSTTYRGGTVVQFDVTANAPDGLWTPETAPRILCGLSPKYFKLNDDSKKATLDIVAEKFGVPALLIAYVLEDTSNILDVGKALPFDKNRKIKTSDTIRTLLTDAKEQQTPLTLEQLVEAVHNKPNFLKPGAGIPVSQRSSATSNDDSFASLLVRLTPGLISRDRVDDAIRVLTTMNGDEPGVFEPGIKLSLKVGDKTFSCETKETDTINGLTKKLKAQTAIDFVNAFYVTTPLLAADKTYKFLSLYPSSTISSSKLAFFKSTDATPNKFNTVYVTSEPDDASSVVFDIGYEVQAMEYRIHDDANAHGYQGSDWLTFIDWKHSATMGSVEIPIPNRQFPIPPTILSHDVLPVVKDGKVDPDKLFEATQFNYLMTFSFEAATQDEIAYIPHYNVVKDGPSVAAVTDDVKLAHVLAQYQAIDAALWEDLSKLAYLAAGRSDEVDPAILTCAVTIFCELAHEIGESWSKWAPATSALKSDGAFRIRKHQHTDGRASVTMAEIGEPAGRSAKARAPSARLLGRKHRMELRNGVQHCLHDAEVPVPHYKGKDRYEIEDPDLTVLGQQNCWGEIFITRNRRLIDGKATANEFVLKIENIRPLEPVAPHLVITQKLDVATEPLPLEARMAKLFKTLLFPEQEGLRPSQLSSLSVAFSRDLIEPSLLQGEPKPADTTVLFAPVVTTPALSMKGTSEATFASPGEVAEQLNTYLALYLQERNIAATDEWSFNFKIFSNLDQQNQPALLLEMLDLRVRMAQFQTSSN